MKKQLSDIICELHIPNFETAKKFYGDLDFKVVWERKPTDKIEGYMVMKRGNSVFSFYSGTNKVYDHTYFKKFPKNTKRGYGIEIIIPINGIYFFYKKVEKKYSKQILSSLKKRFYYPDFRMTDPFGFYLRFVERYNWVDTRNPDGNPKKEFIEETKMYHELMDKE